jgi:hypothetical protein
MGRKLAAKITTKKQFQLLLEVLALDLVVVSHQWTLYKNLSRAERGAYGHAMSGSPTFWSSVKGALQNAALYDLARAYDQNAGPLTLRTVLVTIKANPPFLLRPADFDVDQLNTDLLVVEENTNRAVEHLMMWRNNVFAHRDATKIIDGRRVVDRYPLTHGDIDSLLDNAFAIVNRYGRGLFGTGIYRRIAGDDDYIHVLNTLQAHHDATSESSV